MLPNTKKIIADLENVTETAFWKEYNSRIFALRASASRFCEVGDDVRRYQGMIKAYDDVLALPDKIAKELSRELATTQDLS